MICSIKNQAERRYVIRMWVTAGRCSVFTRSRSDIQVGPSAWNSRLPGSNSSLASNHGGPFLHGRLSGRRKGRVPAQPSGPGSAWGDRLYAVIDYGLGKPGGFRPRSALGPDLGLSAVLAVCGDFVWGGVGEVQMKNRLRVLRAERNWSQADLAQRLEVSRQSVNAVETGKFDPSLPLAFKLARLFEMTIEEIFTDEE